jgi:hypothetical protein
VLADGCARFNASIAAESGGVILTQSYKPYDDARPAMLPADLVHANSKANSLLVGS